MKLDNSTKKILTAGFEKTLEKYGEEMRAYIRCLLTDNTKDSTGFWETAEELERNLLDFVNKILDEIEIKED